MGLSSDKQAHSGCPATVVQVPPYQGWQIRATGMDVPVSFHTHSRLYPLNTALGLFGCMVLFRQPSPINQRWHVRGNPFVILSQSPKAHLCWQWESNKAMLSAPGLPEVSATCPHPHTHPLPVGSHPASPFSLVCTGNLVPESMSLDTHRKRPMATAPRF